jgi:hypothetical protein
MELFGKTAPSLVWRFRCNSPNSGSFPVQFEKAGDFLCGQIRQVRNLRHRPPFRDHLPDQIRRTPFDASLNASLDSLFEQLFSGTRFVEWCQFGDHLSDFLPAFGFEAL